MFAENILTFLSQKLDSEQLSHAYLIDDVQDTLADYLAEKIQSIFASYISVTDYHYIQPEQGSYSIKIDQIREVVDRLSRKPAKKCHLVVIRSAHLMNQSAANALLKALEEPPGYTHFLLLTPSSRQLLPTILSRVQILRCDKIDIESFQDDPNYPLLFELYKDNPAQLCVQSDKKHLLNLYQDVYKTDNPYMSMQGVEINTPELIDNSLQLMLVIMRQSDLYHSFAFWEIYQDMLQLSKEYRKAYNLNERTVIDRLGIGITALKQLAS